MKWNVGVVCKLTAAAAVLYMALAPDAKAGCKLSDIGAPLLDLRGAGTAPLFAPQTATPDMQEEGGRNDVSTKHHPIVGMWINDIYQGTNTQPSDHAMEQFSSDGNELINSGGFAPAAENMCFGVWEPSGPRSITLTHIGWDFDPLTGAFKGAARIIAHITVSRDGDSFSGEYVQDEVDPSGNVIPGSSVTGPMKGRRIKVVKKLDQIHP